MASKVLFNLYEILLLIARERLLLLLADLTTMMIVNIVYLVINYGGKIQSIFGARLLFVISTFVSYASTLSRELLSKQQLVGVLVNLH